MARKENINTDFSDVYQEGLLVTALLYCPEAIGEVMKMMPGNYVFQYENIRNIYDCICELYTSGAEVDEMALRFHMARNGKKIELDKSGLSLKFDAMTPSDIESIAIASEGLISLYRRQVAYKMNLKLNASLQNSITDDELATQVFEVYESLTIQGGKTLEKTMSQVMDEMMQDVDRAIDMKSKGKLSGVPTGSDKIDRLTGGWQEDEIIIFGGRPGALKTACAIEAAVSAAEQGYPVGYFSLEMKARKLALRIVSMKTGIPYDKAIKGLLSKEERQQWYECMQQTKKLPIYFYDDVSIADPEKMEVIAVEWARKYKIKLAIVDYLQLLQSKTTRGSRYEQITQVSISLKRIQLRLNIPMIILAQLKRDVDDRPDPRPIETDLKESGQIEQDASTIILLFNPERYRRTKPDLMDEETGKEFERKSFFYYFLKRRSGDPGIRVGRFADPGTNRFADSNIFEATMETVPSIAEQRAFASNRALDTVPYNHFEQTDQLPF